MTGVEIGLLLGFVSTLAGSVGFCIRHYANSQARAES